MKDLNLIRKIAHSFHATTGVNYDDLFSEATIAYYNALRSFHKGTTASFSTYAWKAMKNALISFAKKEMKFHKKYISLDHEKIQVIENFAQPEYRTYDDWYESLPIDCKNMVKLIFDNEEMIDNLPKMNRTGKVVSLLREQGWTYKRIWKAVREIKVELR